MTAIDQSARDTAAEARNRIIAHEEVCAERWRNVGERLDEMRDAIRFQTRQMWAANAAVITFLLGAVVFLANQVIR